jgi:hypothetical protein
MDKLEKCPLCGSNAYRKAVEEEVGYEAYCCSDPNCPLTHVMIRKELWNTRPLESALQARIEELEKEKTEIGGGK